MGEPVKVLGLPPDFYLSPNQARRVTCLALVLSLVQGRSVHITTVHELAQWVYGGDA